jgi:poly(3-hydroxybutyrate) depolymerase
MAGHDAAVTSDSGAHVEPPSSTSGCGLGDFPIGGMQALEVDGMQREFLVALPDGYDAATPHRLIFAWHGQRGTAQQVAAIGYYGLESRAGGTAIFVSAQGLDTTTGIGGTGWDNTNGRDIAFTRAMLDYVREHYCIDDARIFSVGMSYGGIMSNNVGCALGDMFRAIAPMAGLGPINAGACVGQVAVWEAYGNADTLVPAMYIDQSREHWVASNHCAATTQPAGSNGCVAYDDCDEGHPVFWCLFDGAHVVPPFAGDEIWAFFSQF